MDTKKLYEQLYIGLLVIVFFGLIGLGLWALKKIAILSFIVLITSSLISFLTIKNFNTFKNGEECKTIISAMMYLSLISGAFIWFGNHKDRAIIEGIFVEGKIIRNEYFFENDDGPGGQNKVYYELKPTNNNSRYIETLDWILIIISLGIQIVNFKCLSKVDVLNKQQKFMRKYPNWKGEIPIPND